MQKIFLLTIFLIPAPAHAMLGAVRARLAIAATRALPRLYAPRLHTSTTAPYHFPHPSIIDYLHKFSSTKKPTCVEELAEPPYLHACAERDLVEEAKIFIEHEDADVNAQLSNNYALAKESDRFLCEATPLHLAKSAAMCDLLIKHGADVDAQNYEGSRTSLWTTSSTGCTFECCCCIATSRTCRIYFSSSRKRNS